MKKSILALLMLVSPAVSAQAPGDDVRKIAYHQAVEALDRLDDRIRTCEAQKDRKISEEVMPKLQLTDKEWNLALFILSVRADDFCSGDAYNHVEIFHGKKGEKGDATQCQLSANHLKRLKYQAWHAQSKPALKGAQHGTDEGYFKIFIRQSIVLLAMTLSKVNIDSPRAVLPVIAN